MPVDAEGLDVARARGARGDARLVYVTPSHQYPLGVPMSLARRLALLHWAQRRARLGDRGRLRQRVPLRRPAHPVLHGLDVDGRVIYVGSFSKTLFPALRLGFLIVPPDLQEGLVAARAAADQHPPVLDQAVLADFIVEGHFARHLRRMRVAYRERLEALNAGGGALLRRRAADAAVRTGLHALADLDGCRCRRAWCEEAAARGASR